MVCGCDADCVVVAACTTALSLRFGVIEVKDPHHRHPRHNSLCTAYSAADDCPDAPASGYEQYVRERSRTAKWSNNRAYIANADNNLQHLESILPYSVLHLELQRLCRKLQRDRLEGHSSIYRRAGGCDNHRNTYIGKKNPSKFCWDLLLDIA